MSENKVARIILSALTGKNIVEVHFRPTEYTEEDVKSIKYYRIDFSATVEDETGNKQLIIIELQKIRLSADIFRFRRYLSGQYQNKENTFLIKNGKGDEELHALPIISIYILGYQLDDIEAPVIKVNRKYVDAATGEEIMQRHEFIESLTHDSVIVQVPCLKEHRRTKLEKLLSIFDQTNIDSNDEHLLNMQEDDLPIEFQEVYRRLIKAISEPKVRENMNYEDDLMRDLENKEKAIKNRDKTIEEKDKTIEQLLKEIENLKKRTDI